MMNSRPYNLPNIFKKMSPYAFIGCIGLFAFAPVSFMLRSMKNDIIALDYPIKYFISQCIHNREIPLWFNTWGMGFPLQSNLTWGIYSLPQMFFSTLFNYNIYVLHIEFIFYVLLAGWSMFYLLKTHFLKDEIIAQILACSYMLSGFIVGSSQWLFDITAAAFIPILLSSLLLLLKSPSLKNSFSFSIIYLLTFTNIYIPLSIISTYCILLFCIHWIVSIRKDKIRFINTIRHLILAGLLAGILCLPCLVYTFETLANIDRGSPIINNLQFFNSNYLPPSGLLSIFLPLSSVRLSYPNTEGTMFDTYMGLFILLTFPVITFNLIRKRNWNILGLGMIALLFLFVSFGNILPLRNLLNILPGFTYFRHPGIFRLYFIFFIILFLASALSNNKWNQLFVFNNYNKEGKKIKWLIWLLMIFFITCLFTHIKSFETFQIKSMPLIIKNLSLDNTIAISSIIQIFFLILIFLFVKQKKYRLLKIVFAVELVINAFLCTPFFTVSSYSLWKVNAILYSAKGFPIQTKPLTEAPASFTDNKNNTWANVNVFNKEISANPSYRGPLALKENLNLMSDSSKRESNFNHIPVFIEGSTTYDSNNLKIIFMKPSHVSVQVNSPEKTKIRLLQNYFPGWKAYYNNSNIGFIERDKPGLTVAIPAGKGIIDFKYERKSIWISALLLHVLTISFLGGCLLQFMRRNFI